MSLPSPVQLLRTYGLTPKNSFGQNFLSDANQAGKIAELAAPEPGLNILEIGSGLGALTDELLARGAYVTAVERDRDLVPALGDIFQEQIASNRLKVLEADAKSLDWAQTFADNAERCQGGGWVLAGNLPYQITGPLLEKTVQLGRQVERAVYLVQKEVAERLAASPSTKTYGALTVFVQAQFTVKRAFVIKPGAFHPAPRIDSAVVVLTRRDKALTEEHSAFRKIVKGAFAARRKTLRNAWKALLPAEQLAELASRAGIELDKRGETLSVEQFAEMGRLFQVELAQQGIAPDPAEGDEQSEGE